MHGGLTLEEAKSFIAENLAKKALAWATEKGVVAGKELAQVLRQSAINGASFGALKQVIVDAQTKCPGCHCDGGCPNNRRCGVRCWETGGKRECP